MEAKRAHLPWGPRQILPSLARRRPDLALPAPRTAGELFQREGLSQTCTRRRGHRHPGASPLPAEAPKAVWTADFKGQFRTGDGLYCAPLTVADAYSRLLFCCSARLSTTPMAARPIFEPLVREYGLPEAMRTDNGAPFAPPAFCGLSQLAGWWGKLGSRHQRIEPGRPAQHGAHARLHRPLKAEATRPPEHHHQAQPARVDRFCCEDNEERPHEALNDCTPASRSRPSARPMPAPAEPGHYLVRRVSHAGTLRFQSRQRFMRDTLLQEAIALEETAAGMWSVSCSDVWLARLDERTFKRYG